MRVTRLSVDGVRNLREVALEPGPRINLLLGENGAGKTSLLEALHCLSRGRSFRGSGRHEYLNRDTRMARIVAEVQSQRGSMTVGIERSASHWQARAAGEPLQSLGELAQHLPFMVFHPGLHVLIEGAPEERRRFLDFGVFHVEPAFLPAWRRYRQALRQRNAALRATTNQGEPAVWDTELVENGLLLHARRNDHLAHLVGHFDTLLNHLAPELAPVRLELTPGWPEDQSFSEALARGLASDREHQFTRYGPHRSDLRIVRDGQKVAGRLSRGQQKMVALAMMLAQARCLGEETVVPMLGFDDLPSELDADRQQRLLALLAGSLSQVWITGTVYPEGFTGLDQTAVFHVKHGQVEKNA